MSSVFMSYSHKDRATVERIARKLRFAGVSVWYDEWSLEPGDPLRERIESAIADSDYLVVFLSRNSISSRWVTEELNAAFVRELEERHVIIISVLLGRLGGDEIPLSLRNKVYIDLRYARERKFEEGYNKLLKKVKTSQYPNAKVRDGIKGLFFVEDLVFHPSGRFLAWFSGGGEGWVSILDLNNLQIVSELKGYVTDSPNGDVYGMNPIAFSSDGNLLAVGHDGGYGNGDGTIDVYYWREKTIHMSLRGPNTGVTYLVPFPLNKFHF